MLKERVADNIYWFQSEDYAQVTASVIAGPQWAVLIDTLAFPDETLEIRDFVEHNLTLKVQYIINTHYHADHAWGNCFFPGATIIGHSMCRELLRTRGADSLAKTQEESSLYERNKIVLPHITLDSGSLRLRIGKKNLRIMPALGHSMDGLCAYMEEEKFLFSGDAFMTLPHVVDGDFRALLDFYHFVQNLPLENIIQGHGDIILRGEIEQSITENIDYLNCVHKTAKKALRRREPYDFLLAQNIEDCGKSRILLGGMAPELHLQNLLAVYRQLKQEKEAQQAQ